MSDPCPKCAYVRQPGDPGSANECPQCGVFHDKYQRWLAARAEEAQAAAAPSPRDAPFATRLWATLWYVPDRVDLTAFYGRCLALTLIVAWGAWFIAQPWDAEAIGQSFLHRPDLVFHEAGHVFFRIFGEWMMYLGGSLFQCVLPLGLALYFLLKAHQPFSAAVCLWWCGQNLIDVAPYIGDARAMALPLLGEWSEEDAELRVFRHDWHNILEPLGLLSSDRVLGRLVNFLGCALMVLSGIWAGLILRLQKRAVSGDVYRG